MTCRVDVCYTWRDALEKHIARRVRGKYRAQAEPALRYQQRLSCGEVGDLYDNSGGHGIVR